MNGYPVTICQVLRKEVVLNLQNVLGLEYSSRLFSAEDFLELPHSLVHVKGRVCVDIGAFNGDTAISFEKRGEVSVLAFELSRKALSTGRNIQLNRCTSTHIFNQGVSDVKDTLLFDDQKPTSTMSLLKAPSVVKQGAPVTIQALESVVEGVGLRYATLKGDCGECHTSSDSCSLVKKLDAVGVGKWLPKIPHWSLGMRTESMIRATAPGKRKSERIPELDWGTVIVSVS